jgi:hypothetical protein
MKRFFVSVELTFFLLFKMIMAAWTSACLGNDKDTVPILSVTGQESSTNRHATVMPTLENQISILSILDYWPLAMVEAQKWHTDAYIHRVVIDINLETGSSSEDIEY